MRIGHNTTRLLKAILSIVIYFILMSGVDYYFDGEVNFGVVAINSLIVGLFFVSTDKLLKKNIGTVVMKKHIKEDVQVNEERNTEE